MHRQAMAIADPAASVARLAPSGVDVVRTMCTASISSEEHVFSRLEARSGPTCPRI